MANTDSHVTIHMAASLDGFVARKDGRVDWLETSDEFEGGDTMAPGFVEAFLKTIDCYVMGSRTYETALSFEAKGLGWSYGDKPIFVLTSRELPRTRDTVAFYSGDLAQFVNERLRPTFRSIWFVGGSVVSAECLRLGLADEVRYSILPILIGDGIPFFEKLDRDIALHLADVKAYGTGMVELCYEVRGRRGESRNRLEYHTNLTRSTQRTKDKEPTMPQQVTTSMIGVEDLKPKAKGTSRASKPRKSATKSKSPPKAGAKAKPGAEAIRANENAASRLIDERIRSLGGWRAETLAEIRRLIHEADPDIVEECKWIKPTNPLGVPVWAHAGIVCTGEAYKQVVKLTFARGASLEDPWGLFNSSLEGNTRRAIDIHEGEKVDAGAFKALVKAAVAQNGPPAKKR